MKRLSCLFLALISAIGLMVPMAAATDMNENHVNEVYLEAEKLADGTYVYKDESGDVLVIALPTDPENGIAAMSGKQSFRYRCSLSPSQYAHDTAKFDATDSVKLSYRVTFSSSGTTYMGYYSEYRDTYVWFSTPSDNGFYSYSIVGSRGYIHFALKNASQKGINYDATYTVEDFTG